MNKIVLVSLFAMATSAQAGKPAKWKEPPKQPPASITVQQDQSQKQVAQSDADARSAAAAASRSSAHTGDVTVTDGPVSQSVGDTTQSLTDGDVNLTDNTSLTVEGDSYSLPTNSAYAPQNFGPGCGASTSAASNDGDKSFSLGFLVPRWASAQIRDCERERAANAFAQMGLPRMGSRTLCSNGGTARAHGGKQACLDAIDEEFAAIAAQQRLQLELVKAQIALADQLEKNERMQRSFERSLQERSTK